MKTNKINPKKVFLELVSKLENFQNSENFKKYLAFCSRFWRYSPCNQLLIWSQCKDATRVAGFRTWNQLGRKILKGQHGISILAPITGKKIVEDENGEEKEVGYIWFKEVKVWDVKQTEGAELPELQWRSSAVEDNGALENLETYCKRLDIKINYENIKSGAQGVSKGGAVVIAESLKKGARFAVLAHELAHEIIHRGDKEKQKSKEVKETEAEAVAYMATVALGIENESSIPYLAIWSDKNKLMESMKVIAQTAKLILSNIIDNEKSENKGG